MTQKSPHSKTELEALFDQHYGLLVSQAISFRPPTQTDLDEYIQVAALGMINAIDKYDKNKSKFSTYAICCIRNALKNYLRGQNKFKSDVRLEFEIETKDPTIIDEYLPDSLTDSEYRIFQMKIEGWTTKDIAEELNWRVHRVRKALGNAYEKIKEAYEKSIDG